MTRRRSWLAVAGGALALASSAGAALSAQLGSRPGQGVSAAFRDSGVLVAAADDLVVRPRYPGLWLVSTQGRVSPLLPRSWSPVGVASNGTVAAFAADAGADGRLTIVSADAASAINGSGGATCVSFSADAAFVSYVTGTTVTVRPPGERAVAFGIDGDLWVAPVAAPASPQRIAGGLFLDRECPAWSSRDHVLAYLLRESGSSAWAVGVYEGGSARTIHTFTAAVPTVHWRTFVWSPTANVLAFLAGDELMQYTDGAVRRLLSASSVATVMAEGTARGTSRYSRDVSFSPNGRFVAVSVGLATGIYTRAGRRLRLVPGEFAGWSGNVGVLVIDKRRLVISLYQYLIRGGRGRLLLEHFKNNVYSDPAGRWYAYPNRFTDGADPRTYRQLFFRVAGGRLLRRVTLPFIPRPLAAVAVDGRIALPAGGY